MYNSKNLLDIAANCQNKYVTALMDLLFTKDEQKLGLIIDDNSTSKRVQLDPERVKLIKRIKIYYL